MSLSRSGESESALYYLSNDRYSYSDITFIAIRSVLNPILENLVSYSSIY